MDYSEVDKEMNRRVHEIYSDPARHKFYSQYDYFLESNAIGPRGDRIVGLKTKCQHCGGKKNIHAETTEELWKIYV